MAGTQVLEQKNVKQLAEMAVALPEQRSFENPAQVAGMQVLEQKNVNQLVAEMH